MDDDLSDDDPTVEEELLEADSEEEPIRIATDLPVVTRPGEPEDFSVEDTVDDLRRIDTSSLAVDGGEEPERGYDPYDSTPKKGR
jgi:hypothetical protein